MATNEPTDPRATAGFVRIIGALELVGGAVMWYTGANWYLDGIIPERWVAIFLMALGAVMLIAPQAFRKRASRFQEIADRLENKQDRKP